MSRPCFFVLRICLFTQDTGISDTFTLPKKRTFSEEYIRDLTAFHENFHNMSQVFSLRKNSSFYELMARLMVSENDAAPMLSDKIASFLEKQTDKAFTKELIENEFYLSYSYMSAVFKREKGTSPGSFHNTVRMNKAAEMLRSSSLSIGQIAEKLGFNDMLYFSRRFHQSKGLSPSEYRKYALLKY